MAWRYRFILRSKIVAEEDFKPLTIPRVSKIKAFFTARNPTQNEIFLKDRYFTVSGLIQMISYKQDSFGKRKQNVQNEIGSNGKFNGGDTDACSRLEFPMSPSCSITCQKFTEFFHEKEPDSSKLLDKDLEKTSEAFEAEDNNEDLSDDENKIICFEQARTSVQSQGEEFESDFEDNEKKEYQKGIWEMTYENETTFDSICGLDEIKEILLNVFIYPSVYPQFFPRKIRWNQILLYGPPGTGKTMLAKALAPEINATLYRITSADLLSHWQGQTEKQIRDLFQEIRGNAEPAILFFDEIDGLFRKRTSSEDESTRRIKTELLTRLDDFTAQFVNHQTYLIGATNCPWEIDSSFMRRFHKKIFVPLPNKEARVEIIKQSFENIKTDLTDLQWDEIGERTEGYSGSDLINVVMTSCCVRFMQTKRSKYWEARGDFWVPVGSSSLFSSRANFEDIHPDKVGIRNILFSDLTEAVVKTPKTVSPEEILKYLEFSEQKKME